MKNSDYTYKTIINKSIAEFSDRGSKFIGFAYPVETMDEIKNYLKLLKELHPKAVHYCYAYRLGFDKLQYRANDDGEPAGSAGRPILGQIDGAQITNVLIVVVRYFGGVLLGVPGLINAYKTVAQNVLKENTIIEKNRLIYCLLKFDYTQMNEVMRIVKAYHCEVKSQSHALFCEIILGIALAEKEIIMQKLLYLHGVSLEEI